MEAVPGFFFFYEGDHVCVCVSGSISALACLLCLLCVFLSKCVSIIDVLWNMKAEEAPAPIILYVIC